MKNNKMLKKIAVWGGVIAVGVVGWFLIVPNQGEQLYDEQQVVKVDVQKTINADAVVNPDIYVDIRSELPTLVTSVSVQVNDRVQKGQELFRLDRKSVLAQLANARLALERVELAEKQARRKWDLLKPEEREGLKKATEQARQTVNEVYAQVSKTVIVAPIDGVVTEQNIQVGEIAQGVAMKIVNTDSLQVEALVPEVDIAKVKISNKTKITFDAYPGKVFIGVVSEIDTSSIVRQNSTYFRAVIGIDKIDVPVLPGMNAEVDIEIENRKKVAAVLRDFAKKDAKGYFVYVLSKDKDDDKQFTKQYFTEGLVGDKFVEVDSGLTVGENIVLPKN